MHPRAATLVLVALTPLLMAPSCGVQLQNCDTSSHYWGAHALEPDGTLDVLRVDHDGATWERRARPWSAPTTVLALPGTAGGIYLPRVAAPGGERLLVSGPAGALTGNLYDLDRSGAHLVPLGAEPGDHVDFAAALDGATPYVLAARYHSGSQVTLTFLSGPAASGTDWSPLGSVDATLPAPLPSSPTDAAVEGEPVALVREASGDLVGFELAAGLVTLSAAGTISQPALALPHPPLAAAATRSASGQAIVYLLTEDASVTPLTMRLDRIRHEGATFTVETLAIVAPWQLTLVDDRINSQVAAIDEHHVVVLAATIGDPSGDYWLFYLSEAADGSWSVEVPCVGTRCDNANLQRGYTRLAVGAGPLIAVNGGDPSGGSLSGAVSVLDRSAGQWTATGAGAEGDFVFHPCEHVQGCAAAPGRPAGGAGGVALFVAALLAAALRRGRTARSVK
jgi:hypothetical protein